MALADLSFRLFTDANLTTPFSGTHNLLHYSDLSDGSQDFLLYFGSPVSNRILEASSNRGVDQIYLTPTDITPKWEANKSYIAGNMIEPFTENGYRYRCTSSGNSGSTEPTFPTASIGDTVLDGSCTWYLESACHEPTEIKLATSSAGLDSATGGAALSLTTSVLGGSGNAVEIHIRYTNAVTDIGDNSGYPEIGININNVVETQV